MASKKAYEQFHYHLPDLLKDMGIQPDDRAKLDALTRYTKIILRIGTETGADAADSMRMPGGSEPEDDLALDWYLLADALDDYRMEVSNG